MKTSRKPAKASPKPRKLGRDRAKKAAFIEKLKVPENLLEKTRTLGQENRENGHFSQEIRPKTQRRHGACGSFRRGLRENREIAGKNFDLGSHSSKTLCVQESYSGALPSVPRTTQQAQVHLRRAGQIRRNSGPVSPEVHWVAPRTSRGGGAKISIRMHPWNGLIHNRVACPTFFF